MTMSDSESNSDLDGDLGFVRHEVENDVRDPSLRRLFESCQDVVDAVKLVALKQGKGLQQDPKSSNATSVVLGCTDRLRKNQA